MKELQFFRKIFIVEDIRRCADHPKAHADIALVTGWKQVFLMHHDFMGRAVSAVVDHFEDAGFRHRLSRQVNLAMFTTKTAAAGLVATELQGRAERLFARYD